MARRRDPEERTGITCELLCIVPDPQEYPRPPHRSCLVRINGAELGRRHDLGDRPVTIGRDATSDIRVEYGSVAPIHAILSADDDGVRVRSAGGETFVNDRAIDETGLQDGDLLRIGPAIFKHIRSEDLDRQIEEERFRLRTLDPETRTFNRAYFLETLERELRRARRYDRPLALVLLPFDRDVGADSLAGLAGRIQARLHKHALLARYTADAFVALTPELDHAGASALAAALRMCTPYTPGVLDLTDVRDSTDILVSRIDALLAGSRRTRA